jgi:hypothetical protein
MVVLVFWSSAGGGYAEANLSAQEAEAKANTRFSGTPIEQRRTEDPEAAPKEGAQAVGRRKTASEEAKLEGRLATASLDSVSDRVVYVTLEAPRHGAENSTPTH